MTRVLRSYWMLLLVVSFGSLTQGEVNVIPGEYIADANTVGLWHLNDGTGNVIYSSVGSHNGTFTGNTPPQWVSGYLGTDSLYLTCGYNDTNDKYGAIQFENGLFNRANMTLEMYVKWDPRTSGPNPSETSFLGNIASDGSNMFVRGYTDGTNPLMWRCTLRFGVYVGSGWIEIWTPHELSLLPNEWTHLAFTRKWDGVNTTIAIYVNGVQAAIGGRASTGVLQGSTTIIGDNRLNNVSWGGAVDEIRLSNFARTKFGMAGCGDWGYLVGDLNKDCNVNFKDIAILANDWMMCTNVSNPVNCSSATGFDFIQNGKLIFQNSHYSCELSVGNGPAGPTGLKWGSVFNKTKNTEYLYDSGNLPVFKIFGDNFAAVDSTSFVINSIDRNQAGDSQLWQIRMSYPDKDLGATLNVEINDTEKMQWTLSVQNNSMSARKIQPVFPLIGRINIGNSLTDNSYFFPWRSGVSGSIDCFLRSEYGNCAWMQITSVFNTTIGAGLFTYPLDSTGGFKGLEFKKLLSGQTPTVIVDEAPLWSEQPDTANPAKMGDLMAELSEGIAFCYYYPKKKVEAGGEYNLPMTVLSIYEGGWKESLSDYSNWAHTWYTHVDTPQWFKNVFNSVGGHPGYYYSDSLGRYVRSESMGDPDPIHLDQWYGWWDGYDESTAADLQGKSGDYYYNASRGGLTPFKNEIQAVQAKGTRVTLYIDNRFCWHETDIGQAHGQAWATMNPPGTYAVYQKPTDFWLECVYEPNAWVDYMASMCARIVHDTSVDGIYLDELPILYPCYNPNHAHYQRDNGLPFSVDSMRQFLIKVRNAIRSENSDAILYTEHAGSDYFSQFIDGSWSQAFYKSAFPFAEQYYNIDSLNYFRFCFPEFKLLEWGPSSDWERRTFFNGIGICNYPLSDFTQRAGQVLKENGDAFASLNPEPLINTLVSRVLANRFPIAAKSIYTIYNKSGADVTNTAIVDVPRLTGYHYVELLNDSNAIAITQADSNDRLTFDIDANEILCIGQLPQIIQANQNGNILNISLSQYDGNELLVAFWNYDSSSRGYGEGQIINLTNGQGSITLRPVFGKLILKLYRSELLVDEFIFGVKNTVGTGTLLLWHLDETSGSIGYDAVGHSNLVLGTGYSWSVGNPSISPGRGVTATLNGDTYCYSWVHPDDVSQIVNASVWVKFASIDTNGSYVLSMDNRFLMGVNRDTSTVMVQVITPDGVWHSASAKPLGSVSVVDGKWHKIGCVYDGRRDVNGNANLYFYWDSTLKATNSFAAPVGGMSLMPGGSGDVYIGTTPLDITNQTYNFLGRIDEISLSNTLP